MCKDPSSANVYLCMCTSKWVRWLNSYNKDDDSGLRTATNFYLRLFPANTAPCFLQVTRGVGTPLTIHSRTVGWLTSTDTTWGPSLIDGATEERKGFN